MSRTWLADEAVARHAVERGAEPAVLDGESVLTWAALDARSRDIAVAVRAILGGTGAGAPAGERPRVALVAETSPHAVAAILGILRAGATVAPVPAGLTGRELATALDVLAPALVVHDAARAASLAGTTVARLALASVPASATALAQRPTRDLALPAVIVLTSGTTGRPKGVVLSGAALAASASAWLAVLPRATGWALPLGLAHVAGLGVLWRAIEQGVPVRILPPGDPGALLAALVAPARAASPALSHVSLVPAQLARLLDAADAAGIVPPDTLLAVPLGGGIIPASLVERAAGAGWPVVPTYGLSECGSGVTALPAAEALDAPGTAGRPLAGVQLVIDAPDADGIGEVLVRTPASFSGYLGEPQRELGEPVRTGDLGWMDEAGRLVLADRRTDRIVRGGENISPAEVEVVLLAHPAIADACVIARPDDRMGQVPVAAVVLRDGVPDPGDAALTVHARASLAGFKVPVLFARLDTLPRTTGGKLRREAVRALLAGERRGELARPGGDAIGWRLTGAGPVPLVLLHGTLSTGTQLDRLAAGLAKTGAVTVHALDRRGSGTSRLADPRPLDVSVHVGDVVAYLDARGIGRAILVGVSFGGGLALEIAARHPERVIALVAYEPPYGPVGPPEVRDGIASVGGAVEAAYRAGGAPAAAETFLRAVAGDAAWDRLPDRARVFLAGEGDGALADAGLNGLDPDGLSLITAPATILTGGASDPFYAPIADGLVARIPGARRDTLEGLSHPSPITSPATVAAAIRAVLAASGAIPADPAPVIPVDPDSPARDPEPPA